MSLETDDGLAHFLEHTILPTGWRVVHEASVTSTNDLAREAARRGWPDRSVFVADYQTAGRGRQGRSWVMPPCADILMSVLLRRQSAPYLMTMLASVAVCETLERHLALEPAIKWPNDVLVNWRKAVGILAEATDDGRERTIVIGIGMNVNVDAETLANLPNATSLRQAAGYKVHRGALLVQMLEQMDWWLALPNAELRPRLWRAWSERLWGRSQRVVVREGGEEVEGVILGADADGALLLRTADGSERRVLAGEILP